ncbi:aldo/keto reductase [Pseudopelagicola sp. nBUS_20]|uniref:aldo/keto reductase n=1 Tax=Pseudopelagicola sp. nBUS_20 TaxID=3395317 RepID=UPI003EBEA2E1
MTKVKWGIIGPGAIAHNFAQGLKEIETGELCAIASRSSDRCALFGDRFGVADDKRYSNHQDLLADPEIDAVYISTPHPLHAQLTIDAVRAGKSVLCEKPGGLCTGELTAVTEAAKQEGVFFMEGLMYRMHPQIRRLLELLREDRIGKVLHISTSFGFAAKVDPSSRLHDPALAGGAILDVGIYPVSLARLIAGADAGTSPVDPVKVAGLAVIGKTGVDEVSRANLLFDGDITADVASAITQELANDAVITGTKGSIRLPDPWTPGRNAGPSDATIEITVGNNTTIEEIHDPRILFAYEAEVASKAIASGVTEPAYPAPNAADSVGTLRVLDDWRRQSGYQLPGDTVSGLRRLNRTLPNGLPPMTYRQIDGLDRDISQMIIGCDNRDNLEEGAIVWDCWIEAGGNAFDTGFVYGNGLHEKVLGDWMTGRGVSKDCVVIVKGAHSPYCTPRAIEAQLEISLDRLQLDHAPIYIMHRDNLDVPVDEFVDVLNRLKKNGKVGIFGGSNWSTERFSEANDYAKEKRLAGFSILNNNLSLATMERPVWPGCISSNDQKTLEFLRKSGTAHLSWSAQARGYFFPSQDRTTLSEDTAPDYCFSSPQNEERLKRATELAADRNVAAHHIASAWVLSQSFPSFALIGPRTTGEIATTLPAFQIELTQEEVLWLNLEE